MHFNPPKQGFGDCLQVCIIHPGELLSAGLVLIEN